MESSPADDSEIPTDDLPPGVLYLLNAWRPKELLVRERNPNNSSMLPPASTTANTASTHHTASDTSRHTRRANRTTRPASFYDKHLADHLILRRVKLLDSLAESIAGVVDEAIKDARNHGSLPPADPVLTENYIQSLTKRSRVYVSGEAGVAEYYSNLTARFCLPVASTLALNPTLGEWVSLLNWTREPNAAGWAIADGSLELLKPPPDVDSMESHQNDLKHVYPDIRKIWDELLDRYPDLAIWEMKSLTVGDTEVMERIVESARRGEPFFWKSCKVGCGRDDHDNINATEDEWPRGFDALQPQWTLNLDDSSGYRHSRRLELASEATSASSRRRLESDSSLTSLGSEGSQYLVRGTRSEEKKRKHEEEEASEWETDQDAPSHSGRKGKRKVDNLVIPKKRASLGKRNHDDESYENVLGGRREVTAQSFLQQVNNSPQSWYRS